MKLWMKLTGVDADRLSRCPQQDHDNVRALGELMLLTFIYQALLFVAVGHEVFASFSQFRPDIAAISIFVPLFVMFIDSYVVMRSSLRIPLDLAQHSEMISPTIPI
ncbi:MAG TPA: hypothetical protein VKX28_11220 [Xanthobacteraceae bacterium]|nr:hypothetical protein [Xanthobacteraceae bacterium]